MAERIQSAASHIGFSGSLYHAIRGERPTAGDFLSVLAKDRIPRQWDDAQALRWAAGVSFNQSPEQVRATVARFPKLGAYIAEVRIPTDGCFVEVARTTDSEGHYTVWASPEYLRRHVVSVIPVSASSRK